MVEGCAIGFDIDTAFRFPIPTAIPIPVPTPIAIVIKALTILGWDAVETIPPTTATFVKLLLPPGQSPGNLPTD